MQPKPTAPRPPSLSTFRVCRKFSLRPAAGERYLHLPGLILTDDGSQTRYLLGDGLGSIRHAVDETAGLVAYHEFDPYGGPVEGGGEPYGFSGEWWEEEVGLLYLRARWYRPEVGIFVSKDPWMGNPLNPRSLPSSYQYTGDNPVNFIDATGLKEWRTSTSWREQIIERVYGQGRPEMHLEYPIPIALGRVDILNSYTGEVFEIKSLAETFALASLEAAIYAEVLNRLKANTILGGSIGLLPQNEPNDWNQIDWHLGNPASFPMMYIPGQTPIYTAYSAIPEYIQGPFDLVAFSPTPGAVIWFFIPKPGIPATVISAYLAKTYWSKYVAAGSRILEPILNCPVIIVPEYLFDENNLRCLIDPDFCNASGPIPG